MKELFQKVIVSVLSRNQVLRQFLGLLLVTLTLLVFAVVGQNDFVSLLVNTRRSYYFLGILFVLYLFRPLFAIPASLFAILVGFEFGYYGIAVAVVGNLVTAVPGFFLGRYSIGKSGPINWVQRTGKSIVKKTGGIRGVIAASISPVPIDIVAYSAGATGIPLWRFWAGTVIGELPWIALYVSFGVSMQQFSREGVNTPLWAIVVATLVSIIVVWRYVAYSTDES